MRTSKKPEAAEKPKEAEKPEVYAYKAVCKCGASNVAKDINEDRAKSNAVTYIIHNNGCTNNLENWQNWITVARAK